ncbi:MAG: gfo/Idh/MocA family oxidoreductase [Gemmatimonadetes bacterium]|nr:MAG: gfo/Idh/MocA family oxidoreductase [Gemmatimonadota bacterium]
MVGAAPGARGVLHAGACRSPGGPPAGGGPCERAHLPSVHCACRAPGPAPGAPEESRDRKRGLLSGAAAPAALLRPFGVPAGPAARGGAGVRRGAVAPRLPGADARAARLRDRDDPWFLPVSRLKLGVIGAGAWGRNHVRTVGGLAEAQLAAVCDADAKVREFVARQYPAAHVTADAADLLGRVDAVVIASPAATHARFALQCVEAGKPCLVEKPFALSVQDAEAVARAAADAGVPVLAGHLLVFHPAVERLRALVQGGDLGRIYYLYGLRVNLGQVRADENALWSFGPHDVSVALYLLGDAPIRVAAQGKSYLQPKVEDVVFLTMEFGSGVLAHVQLSWLDPHKARKLTVVGAKKMVVFDDMEAREKLRIYDKGVDRPPDYGSYGEALSVREGDIFIPKIPNVEPLAAEVGHFIRVARGEEPPRAGAEDGVRVVRVLDAATRSLATGGAPVQL